MKKALKTMQEMQLFLAERGITAHVTTTHFMSNVSKEIEHACDISVFGSGGVIAKAHWASYDAEQFEKEWELFENEVKERVMRWWE